MYDAVHMFARSLHLLNQTSPEIYEEPLRCDGVQKWEHGERLISFMKAVGAKPIDCVRCRLSTNFNRVTVFFPNAEV